MDEPERINVFLTEHELRALINTLVVGIDRGAHGDVYTAATLAADLRRVAELVDHLPDEETQK